MMLMLPQVVSTTTSNPLDVTFVLSLTLCDDNVITDDFLPLRTFFHTYQLTLYAYILLSLDVVKITPYPYPQSYTPNFVMFCVCPCLRLSIVFWKDISDEVIQRVISRGEIYASAGGFRIEDPDLNPLILDIEGSIDSVMGLPVQCRRPLLRL